MNGPNSAVARSAVDVVHAAVDAFNRGQVRALVPDALLPAGRSRIPADAARAAIDERPLSIGRIFSPDPGRVVCALVTAAGDQLVGIYSITDDRVTAARYYFSDVDLLISVGIVAPQHV